MDSRIWMLVFVLTASFARASQEKPCEERVSPAPVGAKDGWFEAPTGNLHFRFFDRDKAKPVLLLIPGNGNDMSDFADVSEELQKRFRLLLIDQPGHGRSEDSRLRLSNGLQDYSVETMAASLSKLLDHLQITDLTVLGHSLGARTAVSLAATDDRVKKLLIEDMDMEPRDTQSAEQTKGLKNATEALASGFDTRDKLTNALKALNDVAYPGETIDPAPLVEKFGCVDPETKKWRFVSTFKPRVGELNRYENRTRSLLPLFKQVKVPILVISADVDESDDPNKQPSATLEGLKKMKAAQKDARFVRILFSTHGIHHGQPIPFVQEILKFTQGTDPAVKPTTH